MNNYSSVDSFDQTRKGWDPNDPSAHWPSPSISQQQKQASGQILCISCHWRVSHIIDILSFELLLKDELYHVSSVTTSLSKPLAQPTSKYTWLRPPYHNQLRSSADLRSYCCPGNPSLSFSASSSILAGFSGRAGSWVSASGACGVFVLGSTGCEEELGDRT
jgi:hypothetical protein